MHVIGPMQFRIMVVVKVPIHKTVHNFVSTGAPNTETETAYPAVGRCRGVYACD